MKNSFSLLFCLLFTSFLGVAQEDEPIETTASRKGQAYIYWGWNRAAFSKSDIRFKGADYDFVLHDVKANDRQHPFGLNPHFNIKRATVPQYNFRLGYFFHNNYNISLGVDHMKYELTQWQTASISGNISNSGTVYDGVYQNDPIVIRPDFLVFEHTDGLNYINVELRRFDEIFDFNKVKISTTGGLGAGILYPKTKAILLDKDLNDVFHVSGYGLNAVLGLNVSFFKFFFLQGELKAGYVNMPNIVTTNSSADKASQSFFFRQANVVFGFNINL